MKKIIQLLTLGLLLLPNLFFAIENCDISGTIQDANSGTGISNAKIDLYNESNTKIKSITSKNDGTFCFESINSGKYFIYVKANGYESIKKHAVSKTLVETSAIVLKMKKEIIQKPIPALQEMTISNDYNHGALNYDKKIRTSHYPNGGATMNYNSQVIHNTESYDMINDNEFKSVAKDPLSTFSIDVDRASYSNVRRFINNGTLPEPNAVRIEEMINYFSYDYKKPKGNDPFSITSEYTDCPWNKKHKLVHVGIKGKEIEMDNVPAYNLVFLIDVSGSMSSPNKLPLLKAGLGLLVDQMREEDKISIVVYAGAAGVVLPPTSGANKSQILDALENLSAGGSTAGGAGIKLAYQIAKENFVKNGTNRVILATDGDFNVGISSDGAMEDLIKEKRNDDIFLTILGFGMGNYKDSKMEKLSNAGNGNYAYIDNILEAKKVLVTEMGGTLITIAKDVKIQVEFNPKHVKGYRLIGYENRLLNNEDFNDDKKDAGELGAGHTVTAFYEIIPAGSDEDIVSVDDLKYQTENKPKTTEYGDEVLTVKFRYKEPTGTTSKLISNVVYDRSIPFERASENLRFAASVIQFGMLLRDSKDKGESNYKNTLALARAAKGEDYNGYRAEFIRLLETAELLKAKN